jgi:chromosome segregation ATPase
MRVLKNKYSHIKPSTIILIREAEVQLRKQSNLERIVKLFCKDINFCHYSVCYSDSVVTKIKTEFQKTAIERENKKTEYWCFMFLIDEQIRNHDFKEISIEILCCQADIECKDKVGLDIGSIGNYHRYLKNYFGKIYELEENNRLKKTIGKKLESKQKLRFCEFINGLHEISFHLKQIYRSITSGGDVELELINNFDPFKGGVIFTVRPPKKPWKNIYNLSGGEKTLSSLSLVFALHYYRPSPLYIMDEIDSGPNLIAQKFEFYIEIE